MTERLTDTKSRIFKESESLTGRVAQFIPGSRRGLMTANNIYSLEDVIERHGEPSVVRVVPIPDVTVAKYVYTLTHGLPHDTQAQIFEIFDNFVEQRGMQLIAHADSVPCEWQNFQNTMQACMSAAGVEIPTKNEPSSEGQDVDNLADAFSVWGAQMATVLLNRCGIQTQVVVDLPSKTRDQIRYKVGDKTEPPTRETNYLPPQLITHLSKRTSRRFHGELIASYLDGNEPLWENANHRLNVSIGNVLQSGRWETTSRALGIELHPSNNGYSDSRSALDSIFNDAGIDPNLQDGWSIYYETTDEQTNKMCREYFVRRLLHLTNPSLVLKHADDQTRPRDLYYPATNGGVDYTTRHYSGIEVVKFIVESARNDGSVVIMQDLSNRPSRYEDDDTTNLTRDADVVYALPEESIPSRDHSLLTIL